MATSGSAYRKIINELEQGKCQPIYFLMGDEPFFIDSIAEYIREHALPEEARDFNQIVLYGNETSMNEVIQRARAYPMGYDRQVIIVKEAQHLMKKDSDSAGSSSDILSSYLKQPQQSTVLVFCYKNGSLDKRKKIVPIIEKAGVLFESKKVRDEDLPAFIEEFLTERRLKMSPKGMSMMSESVGADLSRMNGELEKLVTALPAGTTEITPEFIEEHVGVSKDFNIYEFREAIINKNVLKANKIAAYYESNPKTYPMQLVTAAIFPYFANLMLAFYSPDKTDRGIADQLDLKSTWGVRDYTTGMRNYTATQTMKIISTIRKYDAKSKGVDATSNTGEGLLKELLFLILH
ncbi:MAG: DNA polymerase III subunit delta [Bacteroidaceae bacterium]|nr:DNA polymerase III subunit delta [Bacteroidaceae bacterium]